MKKPCRLLALAALSAFLFHAQLGTAQNLIPTTAPAQDWVSLASSADGSTLAALASYGGLYVSTNSGATWTASRTASSGPEPQRPWTGLTISADGKRLVAVANFNPIYWSSDGGQSWNSSGPTGVWAAVASSADAMKVVAVDHQAGVIFVSNDGGASWAPTPAPYQRWRSVASSADGTKLAAGSDFGTNYSQPPSIYTSTNSGATWSRSSAPSYPWQTIASSADGTKLAAGVYGGLIYLSADSGATWNPANVPSLRWGGIASSADGSHLAAAAWEGTIYLSSNSGRTWAKANAPAVSWQTIAGSADGLRLAAGIWNLSSGGIYTAELAPALHISSSAGARLVSWPAPATGYILEESLDIAGSSWQPVSIAPTIVGGQNLVRIQASNSVASYRLRRTELSQKPAIVQR